MELTQQQIAYLAKLADDALALEQIGEENAKAEKAREAVANKHIETLDALTAHLKEATEALKSASEEEMEERVTSYTVALQARKDLIEQITQEAEQAEIKARKL